jgi:hypothetical protein
MKAIMIIALLLPVATVVAEPLPGRSAPASVSVTGDHGSPARP